ncbi:MAG: LysR family transcriptional regulator [Dorea sp.]
MTTNIQKYMAFLTTVEYGSFTKAAEILHYSQSGISRMIQDLENEWHVTLLERGKNGVRLTSDGIRLLPFIKNICRDHQELQTEIDDLNGLQSGILRIGAFTSVSSYWLPNIVKAFHKDYPNIEYEFLLGDYDEMEKWILEGRVDCGFLSLPAHSELEIFPVEHDELVVILSKEHPLADLPAFPMKSLEEYPFLLMAKDDNTDIIDVLRENCLSPDIRLTTWDDYAIAAMVESNLGISILPRLTLKRTPYDIVIKSLEKPVYREIGFAVREWKTVSQAVKRFKDYITYRNNRVGGGD